jgi:hypothetical protein
MSCQGIWLVSDQMREPSCPRYERRVARPRVLQGKVSAADEPSAAFARKVRGCYSGLWMGLLDSCIGPHRFEGVDLHHE